MLVFHTFFNEFRGTTEADVIQAVYADSHAGTGASYADWWVYQQAIWRALAGITIPDLGTPDAEKTLLTILIELGALERGPSPSIQATASRADV